MNITLTPVEVAALDAQRIDKESTEDVLHRILAGVVSKVAEQRLQVLANVYRDMTSEDQFKLVDYAVKMVADAVAPAPKPNK